MSTSGRPAPACWSRCCLRPPSPPAGPSPSPCSSTGWTPGSVVFLRIAGAALMLRCRPRAPCGAAGTCCPRVAPARRLRPDGRGGAAAGLLLRRRAPLGGGGAAAGVPRDGAGRGLARRWAAGTRAPTVVGIVLALVGLVLVLDVFGGVRIDGIGVAWGLVAAFGLASYFLLRAAPTRAAAAARPRRWRTGRRRAGLRRARRDRRAADGVPRPHR